MKKKSALPGLFGFIFILLMNFINAQFFGGYGRFSISSFFSSIDPETITFGLLFFIFFALIFYGLAKVFKKSSGEPNKGVAGTIALALSLLIIYGIYRSGFNIEDWFYDLGISTGALYLIALIIFIVLAIFLIKKIKFRGFLIVFGLLIILLTIFTEIFYEKLVALIIGIILLIIGILLRTKRKRKLTGYHEGYNPSPQAYSRNYGRPSKSRSEDYAEKARELAAKQRYEHYKQLEARRKKQAVKQRRDQEREERKRKAHEEKARQRYIRRFGKKAWKKREEEGRNF
jgi:hypothetical protein